MFHHIKYFLRACRTVTLVCSAESEETQIRFSDAISKWPQQNVALYANNRFWEKQIEWDKGLAELIAVICRANQIATGKVKKKEEKLKTHFIVIGIKVTLWLIVENSFSLVCCNRFANSSDLLN